MRDEECAWLAREWVGAKHDSKFDRPTQKQIGLRVGIASPAICTAIGEFYCRHRHLLDSRIYGRTYKDDMREIVRVYAEAGGRFVRPAPSEPVGTWSTPERAARYEHAWMLRVEGCIYKEIGDRLGVSVERARQMVGKFNRKMQRACRRARWRTEQ